jgi:cytoskeletal protein RodZ
MESIGDRLREARHNKKASLEDAARMTKIKLEILERLEADEFDQLAAPMYTKGFLKLYAEYLGLDSASVVDAYLKSQGGLRRRGLHVETEASIRARKPRELQLPIGSVVRVVAALTVVVMVVLLGHYWWTHRSRKTAPAATEAKPAATLPVADVEAYYQPKKKPAGEFLEPPAKP